MRAWVVGLSSGETKDFFFHKISVKVLKKKIVIGINVWTKTEAGPNLSLHWNSLEGLPLIS